MSNDGGLIAARQAYEDAQQGVAEAVRAVADAQRDLADANRDFQDKFNEATSSEKEAFGRWLKERGENEV